MIRQALLATALLLAIPAFPHHAMAQYPSCDQIDDPGTRSACHAAGEPQRRADDQRQYRAQGSRTTPVKRPPVAVRSPDPDLLRTFLAMRRRDCWAQAGYQVSLASDGLGPNQQAGMRTDLVLRCLDATRGLPENLATIINNPDAAEANQLLDCMDRLKASHANDAEPIFHILIVKSCVKHD